MEEISPLIAKEVLAMINNTSINLLDKIPYETLINLGNIASQTDERVSINLEVPFEEQNISDDAKVLYSYIFKEYMAEDEDKTQLEQLIEKAAKEQFEEDKKKFNPFKEFNTNEDAKPKNGIKLEVLEIEEEQSRSTDKSITVQENFFKKLLGKIKMMFAK